MKRLVMAIIALAVMTTAVQAESLTCRLVHVNKIINDKAVMTEKEINWRVAIYTDKRYRLEITNDSIIETSYDKESGNIYDTSEYNILSYFDKETGGVIAANRDFLNIYVSNTIYLKKDYSEFVNIKTTDEELIDGVQRVNELFYYSCEPRKKN